MIRALVFVILAALAGCPATEQDAQTPPKDGAAASAGDTVAARDTKDAAAKDGGTSAAAAKDAAATDGTAATAKPETPKKPAKPDPQAEIIGQCMLSKARITKTPSGKYACIGTPKDAGKHCTNATECPNSVCLAESQTCSPLWPLYGCYDILSGIGTRQKYCRDGP